MAARMHHNKQSQSQREESAPQQQDAQRAQLLHRLSTLTHDEINQLFDSIQRTHKETVADNSNTGSSNKDAVINGNVGGTGRHSPNPFIEQSQSQYQSTDLMIDNEQHPHQQQHPHHHHHQQQQQQPLINDKDTTSTPPESDMAPPEFSHLIFGDRIPYWMVILALLFFLLTVNEFANTLAENAQRIQEMEFFTDGINCDNIDPVPQECINGLAQQATVENWSRGLTIILSFTVAPVFGILSDLKGRRPLLIFGMVMNFIQHLMYTLRWIAPNVFTYYYIIISQVIVNSVNISATEAIITDIVPPKSRSMWLGGSLAVMELADIILPQASQFLKGSVAFPAAMALVTVTVIAAIMMPETLVRKQQNDESHAAVPFSWSTLSPVRSFGILLRYRIIVMLSIGFFLVGVLVISCQTLLIAPVGVLLPTSPAFQANIMSVRGALSMFMLTAGQYLLLKYFSQKVVMVLSVLCLVITLIGTATLTSITQIYCWLIPFSVIEVLPPIGLQLLATYIPPREFGTALTAVLTIETFGEAIASQLVVPLYFWWSPAPGTIGPSAGGSMHFFPQLLFSLIAIILCFIFWNLKPPTQGERDDYEREVKMEEETKRMEQVMRLHRSESQRNTMEMLESTVERNGDGEEHRGRTIQVADEENPFAPSTSTDPTFIAVSVPSPSSLSSSAAVGYHRACSTIDPMPLLE